MSPPNRPRIGPRPAPNSRMRINPKLKCFMDFVVKWSPLVMIVGTIFWSYYAFVYHVCLNVLTGVEQIVALIVYHIVFVLFMWSYWRSTVTRPTFVPDVYKLDDGVMAEIILSPGREEIGRILQGVADKNEFKLETRTMSKQMRHCHDCSVLKPDRAHHCNICGGCVLKMDHHCPWVANCVGYSNYKYFLLFAFYGLAYCGIITGFTLTPVINFFEGKWTGSAETRIEMVAVFFVGAGFAIALGLLWSCHVFLVVRNLTTMEDFRPPYFAYGIDKKGFNLGIRVNFLQVFGDDWKLWLLPLFSSQGDGCNWPTRCDATGAVRPRIPRPICSFSKTRVADISWAHPENAVNKESTQFVDSNDSILDEERDQSSVPVPLDTTTATEGDEYFSACASSFDTSSVFIMDMDTSQTPNQEMLGADVENNDVEGNGGGQASGDMETDECTGVTVEGSRGSDDN